MSTGCTAYAGTELEFIVFNDTYEDAWTRGYRDLTPANLYNVDYSLMGRAGSSRCSDGSGVGMSRGGHGRRVGEGRVQLRPARDRLPVLGGAREGGRARLFKTGAKEIAAQEGCSLTFMAKYNEREGNSCHIHFSLRDGAGKAVFAE